MRNKQKPKRNKAYRPKPIARTGIAGLAIANEANPSVTDYNKRQSGRYFASLLATEGVTLEFSPEGITRLAQIAFDVNERTENIGARRLSTVMERLLDEVSFDAANREGQTLQIDAAYVNERLQALSQDEDLSRYIL